MDGTSGVYPLCYTSLLNPYLLPCEWCKKVGQQQRILPFRVMVKVGNICTIFKRWCAKFAWWVCAENHWRVHHIKIWLCAGFVSNDVFDSGFVSLSNLIMKAHLCFFFSFRVLYRPYFLMIFLKIPLTMSNFFRISLILSLIFVDSRLSLLPWL